MPSGEKKTEGSFAIWGVGGGVCFFGGGGGKWQVGGMVKEVFQKYRSDLSRGGESKSNRTALVSGFRFGEYMGRRLTGSPFPKSSKRPPPSRGKETKLVPHGEILCSF